MLGCLRLIGDEFLKVENQFGTIREEPGGEYDEYVKNK